MSPRLSADYDGGITDASMSALLELALALASYRDSLVLVGAGPRFSLSMNSGGTSSHMSDPSI